MAEPNTPPTLQENIENLPEHLGEITRQISEWGIFDLFTSSIARRDWTSQLIERSLSSTHGWIEFLCAAALMFLGYFLIDRAQTKHLDAANVSQAGPVKISFFRHLANRLAWPILLGITASIILKVGEYFSHQLLWFGLIIIAAAWMGMIRLIAAVLHFTLPLKFFGPRYETIFSTTVWVLFLMWITGITEVAINWTQSIKLSVGENSLSLFNIFNGILWLAIIMVLAMWLAKILENRLMSFTRMDMSLRIALSNIAKAFLIVLSFLIALPLVGIDLTILSVFGGALGVGLGFGLQKVASNYVSGFIVLFDRSVRVGDRINVNNFTGYVTRITTRYTVVKNSDGAEALVPNENFIASMVINESFSGKSLWRSIPIQVTYDTNVVEALNILKHAVEKQERVEGEASATVVNFGENGINLNVGFWVKDPENGFGALTSNILLDVWQQFHKANIQFPYPQREVRIVQDHEHELELIEKVSIPTSKESAISNEPAAVQQKPEAPKA